MIEHPALSEFRRNVGVILFNREGKVWSGRRASPKSQRSSIPYSWQFPQGGMEDGETPIETAYRELFEETGVKSVRLISITPGWMAYEFPPEYRARYQTGWRGQRQKWAAMLFEGQDDEVDLQLHEEVEFDAWRWADFEGVAESIVPFKEGIYLELLEGFRPMAKFLKDYAEVHGR